LATTLEERDGWERKTPVVTSGGEEAKAESESSQSMTFLRFRINAAADIGCRFATAYAVTKALLPLRLIISVSATPWFARAAMIPVFGRFRALFSRKKVSTPAASTGATSGGVLPKDKTLPPS
jgi:hypothetical protein